MTCSLCNGTGEKIVLIDYKYSKNKIPAVELCLCKKARIVSSEYLLLGRFDDDYLPFDEIHGNFLFDPYELKKAPNLMVMSNISTFLYQVKSMIMKYRYIDRPLQIYCKAAMDVMRDFYFEQSDGSSTNLSDTSKFSLMIILLGTEPKNEALKNCMLEVAKIRLRVRKPTWLHIPKSFKQCEQEYSESLDELIKSSYKIMELKSNDKIETHIITHNKKEAESFSR